MNKSTNIYAQSQTDQIASDSAQKQQRYWKKIQRTYKNLHGRLQKRRKSWVSGDNSRPKVKKKAKSVIMLPNRQMKGTLMVVEGIVNSKNPKTLSLRKLLDEEREKVTLLWVPGHMGLPRN
jgi:hypothetical protein